MLRHPVKSLIGSILFLATVGTVSVALADYYKYTDRHGLVAITDRLESVPAQYRSSMKVIREEKKKPAVSGQLPQPVVTEDVAAPKEDAAAAALQRQGRFAQFSSRHLWFQPVLYLIAGIAGLVVVVKGAALLPSPQMAKVVYLVFFLGVSVFLYKAYVEHVAASTMGIKEKVIGMFRKANVREAPAIDEKLPAASQ